MLKLSAALKGSALGFLVVVGGLDFALERLAVLGPVLPVLRRLPAKARLKLRVVRGSPSTVMDLG